AGVADLDAVAGAEGGGPLEDLVVVQGAVGAAGVDYLRRRARQFDAGVLPRGGGPGLVFQAQLAVGVAADADDRAFVLEEGGLAGGGGDLQEDLHASTPGSGSAARPGGSGRPGPAGCS